VLSEKKGRAGKRKAVRGQAKERREKGDRGRFSNLVPSVVKCREGQRVIRKRGKSR
jgi:hypothetical protein